MGFLARKEFLDILARKEFLDANSSDEPVG